ncbi:hypothetical protein [Nostoc sp. NMS4]|nr:hypothetical protein [Nostoc sp. NMS4]MBN3924371.1 hypothetical protein [Nostoc sp. NMS4]
MYRCERYKGGKDFRSNHLSQIGAQLGFVCDLRHRPSEGGVVELVCTP